MHIHIVRSHSRIGIIRHVLFENRAEMIVSYIGYEIETIKGTLPEQIHGSTVYWLTLCFFLGR